MFSFHSCPPPLLLIASWVAGGVLLISSAWADSTDTANADFDRGAMLADLADQVAYPAFAMFASEAVRLDDAVQTLGSAPDPAVLERARERWTAAASSWVRASLFDAGGPATMLRFNQISKRPADLAGLEARIAAAEGIDAKAVAASGSLLRGLPAVEALLFATDALVRLQTEPAYGSYLHALTGDLRSNAAAVAVEWNAAEGSRTVARFVAADSHGRNVRGSVNMLANALIERTTALLREQLGTPLGLDSGGEVRPDATLAPLSRASLQLIQAELEGLRSAFVGGVDGAALAFDDYLNALGATFGFRPLSDVVTERFDTAIASAAGIEGSLEEALRERPEQVEALYSDVRLLLIALRTDVAGQLGLTATFNDNDGD
ncbi:MAG: imelysin family protein [Truepera sp.]|nr:imelysin family protein [Truepera sp.]